MGILNTLKKVFGDWEDIPENQYPYWINEFKVHRSKDGYAYVKGKTYIYLMEEYMTEYGSHGWGAIGRKLRTKHG